MHKFIALVKKGEIMNDKILILLGLGAGALYTYFCISTHKNRLYEELYPSSVTSTDEKNRLIENEVVKTESIKEERLPVVQQIVKKDNASFSFISTEPYKFNALLDKDASTSKIVNQINEWCQTKSCENNIQFKETVKEETWSKDALVIVSYMMDNQKITNGSITIKDNVLNVTGELKDANRKEELEKLLTTFDPSIQINNKTTIAEIKETIVETTESLPTQTVTEEVILDDTDKLKNAQAEINLLLQNAVINFKLNSSSILPSSKKVLDNIIRIVNDLNIKINLDILGYTDASGSASYNKRLSQKRADSVKKYLFKHNINAQKMTSVGYGEEKFIFEPNDKRNRRVEIYLTKGE